MNAERTQDMINVIKYAYHSGEDVERCIKTLKRTFGPDVLVNYPYEVEEAFDVIGMGPEYKAFTKHGKRGIVRSSLDKQMENTMRITTTTLRRIIRQSLLEAYEKSEYVQDLPDYERLEKMKKGGRFEKSNISKADEEEAAAHIKYREDLRKDNERKRAEIDQIRQDRNARKKGERYRYDMDDVKQFMSESKLKRPLNEHLHGYKGKNNEKYMIRPFPEEAKQLPHWDEYEEEFRMAKEAIEGNYRKMTALSIDYPKMNTRNVDEDAMDYKHYHEMSATEKYVYCRNELMYLWEDLIRLWKELDEELGIEDGFAGY